MLQQVQVQPKAQLEALVVVQVEVQPQAQEAVEAELKIAEAFGETGRPLIAPLKA